jgi:hypothetical protein
MKSLFAISLLLPLILTSEGAKAGATISDKRYWPSEVGPGAYSQPMPPAPAPQPPYQGDGRTKPRRR